MTLEADGAGDSGTPNRPGGDTGQPWPWPDPDTVRPGPIVPTAGIFPDSETEISPPAPAAGAASAPIRNGSADTPAPHGSRSSQGLGAAPSNGARSAAQMPAGAASGVSPGSSGAASPPRAASMSPTPMPATPEPPPPPPAGANGRWGTWSGFFLVTGVTTFFAFAELYLVGSVGWITGVVLVLTSALSALLMRRRDLPTAVITPPLAFLLAVAISAQPAVIGAQGNLLLQESSAIVTGVAFNAPWVFAATALALVITLIKGARFRRMDRARHMA